MAGLSGLQIDDDEDQTLPLHCSPPPGAPMNEQLYFVGRFLTTKAICIPMMKERLTAVWQPVKGVAIREIGSNTFLFQFFHAFDYDKVFDNGPWNFDGHLLILHKLVVGEIPLSELLLMLSSGSKFMIYRWVISQKRLELRWVISSASL